MQDLAPMTHVNARLGPDDPRFDPDDPRLTFIRRPCVGLGKRESKSMNARLDPSDVRDWPRTQRNS
jgi:hypothetical protein